MRKEDEAGKTDNEKLNNALAREKSVELVCQRGLRAFSRRFEFVKRQKTSSTVPFSCHPYPDGGSPSTEEGFRGQQGRPVDEPKSVGCWRPRSICEVRKRPRSSIHQSVRSVEMPLPRRKDHCAAFQTDGSDRSILELGGVRRGPRVRSERV